MKHFHGRRSYDWRRCERRVDEQAKKNGQEQKSMHVRQIIGRLFCFQPETGVSDALLDFRNMFEIYNFQPGSVG
jgi:hypothetical protein